MPNETMNRSGKQLVRALIFAVLSLVLFSLLYVFEPDLISFSSKGGWYFLVPVAIAFVFSYVHGAFTAHFWDLLGIKAKK